LSHSATYSTLTLTVQFKLWTPPTPHINGYRNGREGGRTTKPSIHSAWRWWLW